jgi:hypothetical protein
MPRLRGLWVVFRRHPSWRKLLGFRIPGVQLINAPAKPCLAFGRFVVIKTLARLKLMSMPTLSRRRNDLPQSPRNDTYVDIMPRLRGLWVVFRRQLSLALPLEGLLL